MKLNFWNFKKSEFETKGNDLENIISPYFLNFKSIDEMFRA
jgi:hypothetical protein